MKYQSAFVSITGKVFVPEHEIEEALEACDYSMTEDEAFQTLARQKLSDLFPTDEPFKMNEIEIAK